MSWIPSIISRFLNALGIRYDTEAADSELAMMDDAGFSWLLAAGVLVVALILLAAGLVIYNILKIAVSQRVRQYGALRASAREGAALHGSLRGDPAAVCGWHSAGTAAGLAVRQGYPERRAESAVAGDVPGPGYGAAEEHDRRQQRRTVGLSAAQCRRSLVFAFLAAAPAARFAAKVSPVAAMSGTGVKVKRGRGRAKKIRSFERHYAWLNLRRSRGRTAITILSLVMSITVFIALQGFLSLLSVAGSVSEHLGDYSIVNQVTGISPEELAAIETEEGVAFVAAQQFSLYQLDDQNRPVGIETDVALGPGETFQMFGLNDRWVEHEFAGRLTAEQLAALKAGEACVVRNPLPITVEGATYGTTHVEEGSVITVAGKELPVLLSLSGYDGYFSVGNSGFVNGVQVLASDRIYPQLTGDGCLRGAEAGAGCRRGPGGL